MPIRDYVLHAQGISLQRQENLFPETHGSASKVFISALFHSGFFPKKTLNICWPVFKKHWDVIGKIDFHFMTHF
jgi:hypothetical protein